MSYSCFTVEIADAVAHIRLNRPDQNNSMTPDFWRELPEAVNDISDNAKARVIVLSAEGKVFSSGMDVSVFMNDSIRQDPVNREVSAEVWRHNITALQDTFSALENARMPVLVAIQGGAVGGALDLITACDCRYATKNAYFWLMETEIGMTADVGTFPRLVKIIPEGWAREMAYTAEKVGAEKAQAIGLVNEVYETTEEMMDAVMAKARKIAGHSPLAVAGCKQMANYARDHTTADALDYVLVWNSAMLRNEDIQEAFTAKMEKRPPVYDDLKPIKRGL